MKIDFYHGKSVLEREKNIDPLCFLEGSQVTWEGTKDLWWKQGFPTPVHQNFTPWAKLSRSWAEPPADLVDSSSLMSLATGILAPPSGLQSLEVSPKPTNL